ncbi:hypothetical protein Bca4012_059136 [Brassica carinata]|uniref:Uncharacterized protein n=1 Tax=Brassica carinata TaxID=52824 RepID=A0A8X7W782_BRACI|nr:hypothetical protein Bca52824_016883 [Brassica carinata]
MARIVQAQYPLLGARMSSVRNHPRLIGLSIPPDLVLHTRSSLIIPLTAPISAPVRSCAVTTADQSPNRLDLSRSHLRTRHQLKYPLDPDPIDGLAVRSGTTITNHRSVRGPPYSTQTKPPDLCSTTGQSD